ncbi:MurR/RpiR family transcriptional regulator [Enterococcus sp. BWB1-3]|uniref:MurR/RpiR family transcriptional regulator n=1 Tax=unclassified Enterococcus TaxID=2608891 RepID=UPI001921015E|nr:MULTISPECIES: MurR/RpiR family transcriptional regulator [unclassified Enterococcus]MBL1229555.1 MurR/RpiR family transcriptional regulator [Enterococcus sp. BWB1-3]MCB5955994.1 MurR/RpiR family transcriptional regulator [Enterococcus sp. CWB-B31]
MGILIENYGNIINEMSESEKNVFYDLDNSPELVNTLNLTDLANVLATSNSTIIRLAQRLGFKGYSQFKYELARLIKETTYINEKDLLSQYQSFFQDSLSALTLNSLEFFAEQIHIAANLFIVGVGLTKPIAEYTSKRLYQINKASMYIYESHMLDLLPQLIKSNDLAIFISMSGETNSLLTSAQKVKQTNGKILSITNSRANSLNNITMHSITTGIPTNVYHNYDITSRAFLMVNIDLILEIYLKRYVR